MRLELRQACLARPEFLCSMYFLLGGLAHKRRRLGIQRLFPVTTQRFLPVQADSHFNGSGACKDKQRRQSAHGHKGSCRRPRFKAGNCVFGSFS